MRGVERAIKKKELQSDQFSYSKNYRILSINTCANKVYSLQIAKQIEQ